ncbi:MAG: phytoene desaturase family protein [Flavisolibacter sp.]
MKKKLVIIGAGFAGLSAAAFMAKAGWDVKVLEKNATAGGRARRLEENGFRFDMGPSWYWMPDVFERFFEQFGKKLPDYYELSRLDPSYRVYWKNGFTDIPACYEKLKEIFEDLEKGSSHQLDRYLKQAETKYQLGMKELVYQPGRSVMEFLQWKILKNLARLDVFKSVRNHVFKHFQHPRLRQLMEFPMLFLGAKPESTPALYSLMNYADIIGGTWYPKGGMYSIVEAMQRLAEEQGAEFLMNEEASEIVTEKGRVVKLVTKKFEYAVDAVISSGDYHFTESQLLKKEDRNYSESYWNKKLLAPSCLMYYIGLNKKLKEIRHHSLFFDHSFDQHAHQIYDDPQWPDQPLFYVNAPSVTDPDVAPNGCENLTILVPIASGLTGDTEERRQEYLRQILVRMEHHTGESISDAIIYQKTFSISDFTNDYHSYKGNAYGLANVLSQTAMLRPSCRSKKIKNLFYAGQFTVPGPGVPPSIISGEVASKELIRSFKSSG